VGQSDPGRIRSATGPDTLTNWVTRSLGHLNQMSQALLNTPATNWVTRSVGQWVSPTLDEPICANDSVTYQNICMMRSAACNQGVELRAIYPGECRDSTHVTQGARYIVLAVSRLITFRVSRRRREMYCGHARLRVCLSVCLSAAACPHYCTDPDVTCGSGRDAP